MYEQLIADLQHEVTYAAHHPDTTEMIRAAKNAILFQQAKIQELERQLANCKDVRASLNARVDAARKVS